MPFFGLLRRICRLPNFEKVLTEAARDWRMKRLFILRHAQAEDNHASQPDFERALTPKGLRDAKLLGEFMAAENLKPQTAFISSAKRTLQTFAEVNTALHIAHEEREEIYNAEFEMLLDLLIFNSETAESLMIVGHNPGVHALATYLAKAGDEPHDFPPASLFVLEFENGWNNFQRRSGRKIFFKKPN